MKTHHHQPQEEKDQEIIMDSLHKNPNLETTNHVIPSPSSSQDHQENIDDNHGLKKTHEDDQGYFFINNNAYEKIKKPEELASVSCSSLAAGSQLPTKPQEMMVVVEESGRERLERHRVEMAGRVWIPDIWGQEDLLKDWIDCTVFDSSLGNNNIMSARAALVQEGRSRSTLRIENRC